MRSSVKAIKAKRAKTDIRVDGARRYNGPASCVLVGNVGTVTGGLRVFEGAKPDDVLLDVAV
jgi:diacylglycerol kinase (ATP)